MGYWYKYQSPCYLFCMGIIMIITIFTLPYIPPEFFLLFLISGVLMLTAGSIGITIRFKKLARLKRLKEENLRLRLLNLKLKEMLEPEHTDPIIIPEDCPNCDLSRKMDKEKCLWCDKKL